MVFYTRTSDAIYESDHTFDDRTAYCKRCGCHWNMAYQHRRACVFAENVTAISHLRARARLDAARAHALPPKTGA